MPEIFEKLGLDAALLISQIVNFLLLIILLKKFAYKPVLNMLSERAEKIEQSLRQAEKIEKELKNTETEKLKEINKAKEEAKKIIEEALIIAQNNTNKSLEETKAKTKEIVNKAKEEIQSEKEKSIKEAEREIAVLAIEIAEKILKKNLDGDAEKKLADETLSKIR
jgi:F-type H+-transporting ATPase subunit b